MGSGRFRNIRKFEDLRDRKRKSEELVPSLLSRNIIVNKEEVENT